MQGSHECCPVRVHIPELFVWVPTAVRYASKYCVASHDTSTCLLGTFQASNIGEWYTKKLFRSSSIILATLNFWWEFPFNSSIFYMFLLRAGIRQRQPGQMMGIFWELCSCGKDVCRSCRHEMKGIEENNVLTMKLDKNLLLYVILSFFVYGSFHNGISSYPSVIPVVSSLFSSGKKLEESFGIVNFQLRVCLCRCTALP